MGGFVLRLDSSDNGLVVGIQRFQVWLRVTGKEKIKKKKETFTDEKGSYKCTRGIKRELSNGDINMDFEKCLELQAKYEYFYETLGTIYGVLNIYYIDPTN